MPSSPATFEHFEVARRADGSLHELGRGAMGVTYKAFDTRLGSYVALKVINADAIKSEVGRVRFEREAKAAAHLNHPNVASIFHRGQGGGTYFYAMQFIEGETFDAFVKRRGPLPAVLALRLILQAAQGLAAASTRGLIHRDIKPANLMLVHQEDCDGDDEDLLVKVIDFGLAKYLNKPGDTSDISLTGDRIVGTPYYMSPEQIDPVGKEIDARADIYSLGVTLWHLLCGNPPFRGTEFQVLTQHMNNSLPWEQLPPTVPLAIHDLLERMMAKDPADRPASHRELVGLIKQQLRTLAGGAVPDPSSEPGQRQDVVEQSTGLPLPPADFSLADVLGRRGALTMGEVLGLLSILAPVVDAKREQEGQAYDLTPGRVSVRFDSPPSPGADLAAQPLDAWPPSQLEIATLAGAITAAHPAQALGALTYELLAGHAPEVAYRPVGGVNARGNALLRQVLEATDAFGSAVRFAEAFRLSLAGELHVPGVTPAVVVVAETDAWKSDTREYPVGGSLLAKPIRQSRGFWVRRAPVLVLLVGLAAGGWWYAKRRGVLPTPEAITQPASHPASVSGNATPNVAVIGPWMPPEGSITTRAVRRYSPPPFFPPAAKAAHQQGSVLLDVNVDAAGNVTGSTIMRGSGFPLLDEAAKQAVSVWKFDPARMNEVAVPSRTLQSIEFKPPPAGVPPEPGR